MSSLKMARKSLSPLDKRYISCYDHHTSPTMAKMELVGDIQQLINDQIRMREGAMKLMSACSTLNQALETSKNLLTINARVLGLMSALQRKKKEHVLEEYNRRNSWAINEPGINPCNGRLAITDIRVPLMWKDNVHFTGKTGDQMFYAFALLRCGDQVRDTQLYEITSVDTDMYFDTTIIFEDLSANFKIEFELYYTVLTQNESIGIRAPMRGHMNLRAPKKSVQFKAPKFCLAGHATLNVDDIKTGVVSKDLNMGGTGASGVAVLGDITEFPAHPLELWGQICCQISAQPKCMLEKQISGKCEIQSDDTWVSKYCEVYQCKVFSWMSESNKHTEADHSFQLKSNMKATEKQTILELLVDNKEVYSFKFADEDEAKKWRKALSISIASLRAWKHPCEQFMHIEEAKSHRLSIPSHASFYDQIDITNCNGDSPKNIERSKTNGKHSPTSDMHTDNEVFENNKDTSKSENKDMTNKNEITNSDVNSTNTSDSQLDIKTNTSNKSLDDKTDDQELENVSNEPNTAVINKDSEPVSEEPKEVLPVVSTQEKSDADARISDDDKSTRDEAKPEEPITSENNRVVPALSENSREELVTSEVNHQETTVSKNNPEEAVASENNQEESVTPEDQKESNPVSPEQRECEKESEKPDSLPDESVTGKAAPEAKTPEKQPEIETESETEKIPNADELKEHLQNSNDEKVPLPLQGGNIEKTSDIQSIESDKDNKENLCEKTGVSTDSVQKTDASHTESLENHSSEKETKFALKEETDQQNIDKLNISSPDDTPAEEKI